MIVTAGSTNVSVYFYITQDNDGGAPGEPKTGLLFSDIETGGSASYMRQGAARTDFSLITLASASAAHSDGGFILVDDTNMPGIYRCDVPDAAFATGVDQVIIYLVVAAANNAVVHPLLIDITDANFRDVGLGIKLEYLLNTALPTNWATDVGAGSALDYIADDGTAVYDRTTDSLQAVRDRGDAFWNTLPDTNATLNNIPFVFKDTNGSYVTSASGITITRSIDGAAFGAVSGTTVGEVGNGVYQIDASAADMNGGIITFRIVATGGTPAAPVDKFVTIVTRTGT